MDTKIHMMSLQQALHHIMGPHPGMWQDVAIKKIKKLQPD